jgi:integrase
MASAWIYQDSHQVEKYGEQQASYYVGWLSPEGKRRCKSCGKGPAGQRKAEKLRRKMEGQLEAGNYREQIKTTWDTFVQEYEEKTLAGKRAATKVEVLLSLKHFKRIVGVERVFAVTTNMVDEFIAKRRLEKGRFGKPVSPATVNKDLRHLKAALNKASEWQYLPHVPKFSMQKTIKKLPTYISDEDFGKLYEACDKARLPRSLPLPAPSMPYPASDWWKGLLVLAYMTGWRIGQILKLKWADVDLDAGTVLTLGEDNKGGRDALLPLKPLVVDHLRKLKSWHENVFPWNYRRETIFEEFNRIQDDAGVKPTGRKRYYGFHDLRRGFATNNAGRLSADQLQAVMQHVSYTTTQGYINMAKQLKPAELDVFQPTLKAKAVSNA